MSLLRAGQYNANRDAVGQGASVSAVPEALARSSIGRENARGLDPLLRERRGGIDPAFWIVVAPGASEQWGHHRAPPADQEVSGTRISHEFSMRLLRAFGFLERGVARFVLISGGAVDGTRPDYNEAHRGRDAMLAMFAARWKARAGERLADRILVDPLARHSTTNLRNVDKLCVELGIDRLLIATTMPPTRLLWPVLLPVLYQTSQGWYFLHHRLSTFDWRCRRELGYALGTFEWFEHGRDRARITGIAHRAFPRERLQGDDYGP